MVDYRREPASPTKGLDLAFGALSDPTRRAILQRLQRGPATVGEVAAPFEMSLNAVSKHVRVLEGAGLLRRDVQGREHRLSLEARPLKSVARFVEGYADFWEGRLDALADHLESKKESD